MCRRCKNARDLFNKILTNFGFPNWPKIYDMHFLVSGSRRGYLAIGNRSWNINEESFVSWFIQFAASWLLVYEGGSRFAIVEILRLDGTWDMGARAEVRQPAPGALGADAEWCIAAGELQTADRLAILALCGYQCLSSIWGLSSPIAFANASWKILDEIFINSI